MNAKGEQNPQDSIQPRKGESETGLPGGKIWPGARWRNQGENILEVEGRGGKAGNSDETRWMEWNPSRKGRRVTEGMMARFGLGYRNRWLVGVN